MMDELRSVVNELNKPPFSKGLTLVSLDQKTAPELLQLIIDVLSEMDSKMKLNVKHEQKDVAVYAITDFVAMLNYKPAVENRNDFQAQLNEDNRRVIHSLLHWLLRPQSMAEFKVFRAV
ncbi:hypothetical protein BVRB_019540 [Beta vulgaris subsp. vulgaris]|uniref:IFT81 calponin homology domain-containing protein n=1 Tax=Beta vulgaris subsp. vulgaris TaxID=3555 RepID=A0A0J8BFA6_BETVV|nr:hypothetical protein BVRB_019540 [Beta vulgaris subsp. vulgaris]